MIHAIFTIYQGFLFDYLDYLGDLVDQQRWQYLFLTLEHH